MPEQKNPCELHVDFIGTGVMGRPMVSNLRR
jgi:3-hydroxyisobutyrate dehydrogenase-like beta-hydroxyacid dehydrogenase